MLAAIVLRNASNYVSRIASIIFVRMSAIMTFRNASNYTIGKCCQLGIRVAGNYFLLFFILKTRIKFSELLAFIICRKVRDYKFLKR